jgi:hypothetical protein
MRSLSVLFVIASFCFSLVACEESENEKLIVGSWSGIEWLVDGKPSGKNAIATRFDFDSTGKYTYDYAGNIEKGTYKVEKDNLFTKPEGGLEMMVKIATITNDSLVFDMSRGGRPEKLTLLRNK